MANLKEIDADFNFCKERLRDPFHGSSVRLRGQRGCHWRMNDLYSLNPEILATNRSVKAIHSSTSSASITPVTAVDMCSSLENIRSAGGIERYGREDPQVLGNRDAWEDVIDSLEEHAISVRPSRYNKSRRTQDLLFEVPIIGHMISNSDDSVSQTLHWPVLNGKAYDPAVLYVSQGATLVAFGCGDRHPLPVVLAPCSAGSSGALCADLGDAFNDGSNAGRKSIPLLPINLHAAKLWVEIDGRDISKINSRHSRNWFASVMQDRCTYIPWSPHTNRNGGHCTRTAISRHALEVFIDLPKPQAITHIGLFGQRAEVDFLQVNGGTCVNTKRLSQSRGRGRHRCSLLKTVVDAASLSWVTCCNLYHYNDASATWALLGKYEANNNSFEEKLIDLKPHFNGAAALVTRRLKIVPTESHGVLPKMRIAIYNGVLPHTAPSSTITMKLSSVPSRPLCERACYGGKRFSSTECRFCWGDHRFCGCKKMIFKQEFRWHVREGARDGHAKGHSAILAASDWDCGSWHSSEHEDDGDDDKRYQESCAAADAVEEDEPSDWGDDAAGQDVDAAGDGATLQLSAWVVVDAKAMQPESFGVGGGSCISDGSSCISSSESSNVSFCDETSSCGSDVSIISSVSSSSSSSSGI